MPASEHEATFSGSVASTSRRTSLYLAVAAGGAGFTAVPVIAGRGDDHSVTISGQPATTSDGRSSAIDGGVLVRAVRTVQNATGYGGVGYYEPEREWLGSDSAATENGASEVRAVKLAYLGVDRASLRTPVADDVRAFDDVSAERVGDLPYFEDPYGVSVS